ncbi:MAG: M24 family metallopeptidase [Candidatus Promineifilaceae bacterium]
MNRERIARLKKQILANGYDGIVLMPGPNMVYLTGIHAHVSERPVLLFIPVIGKPAIIIPRLEAMKARDAGIAEERIFHWSDEEGYEGAFQNACTRLGLSENVLAVEALYMRLLEIELIQRYAPGAALVHAEPLMTSLRIAKDESELTAMQKAAECAENAMSNLLPRIKIGASEKEIAVMLMEELVKAGSQGVPFGPIVSSGPNAGSPHAVPTDRAIQEGELLVIDWGALSDGYPSDITRTFAIGDLEPELVKIYEIVREANGAACALAGPGISGEELDQAARNVIEDSGFGPYFIHRTGHGLGLEIHEPPYIVEGSDEPLKAGAVFTIEPGIYLPDRAGVRIEDDMVITDNGSRTLTAFPRNLITIG